MNSTYRPHPSLALYFARIFGSALPCVTGCLIVGLALTQPALGEESPRLPGSSRNKVAARINGALTKDQILARLKAMQGRETDEIQKLEDSLKARLQDSTSITLKDDLGVASTKIKNLGDQMAELDRRRNDRIARRALIDQLVLAVDSKWVDQPLANFFETQLLDMAAGDLTNPQGSSPSWRFMTYLSIAMREIPERRDDALNVLESYMSFSGVLNPRTPAEFLAQNNYTSQGLSEAAHPSKRDVAGDSGPTPAAATPAAVNRKHSVPTMELRMRTAFAPQAAATPSPNQSLKSKPMIETRLPLEKEPQLDEPYISPKLAQ